MIVSFSFFAKYFDDGFIWVINQDVHEVIKLEAQMGTPRGQGGTWYTSTSPFLIFEIGMPFVPPQYGDPVQPWKKKERNVSMYETVVAKKKKMYETGTKRVDWACN